MSGLTGQNFDIVEGEGKTVRFNIDDDGGSPQPLGGGDLTWTVARKRGGTVLYTAVSTGGSPEITIVDGNIASIVVPPTHGLKAGSYFHELRFLLSSVPSHLADGDLLVLASSQD